MRLKSLTATLAMLFLLAITVRAQTTAFLYQGSLNDGTNLANGDYDFRFRLFNASSLVSGAPVLTNAPVSVTNGLFTVSLDFGNGAFDGSTRTLEIAVHSYGDTNAYSVLSPRQSILSTPYAIQAISASNAVTLTSPLSGTNISGTIPDARLSANVALLSNSQTFTGANTFNGVVTAGNPANVFNGTFFGNHNGNGFGLTNLPATNLVGTLPDARLSTNTPLLNANQIFGASNTFIGTVTATNAANQFDGSFSGNGGGLTNVGGGNLVGTIPDERLTPNVALQSNPNLNFAGNVNAVLFTGSGHGLTNVPGAFFWVTPSGSSVTAQSNVGYILTNDLTPFTITLPTSLSIGDTFKVAGLGAAGWIIAQNAGQNVLSGNLSSSIGQSWKTNGPAGGFWTAVASSADGIKLAATTYGGLIYVSTNSGATWSGKDSGRIWSSIAASADGTKWVASVGYTVNNTAATGYIYTSSDSGSTWTAHTGPGALGWSSVASSADGTKLVAAAHVGYLYTSTTSGSSWTARVIDSTRLWTCVASSADGTKLVAGVSGGYLYTSTNSGTNWTQQTASGSRSWTALASSADGSRLVAAASGDQIYISTDSGVTWTPSTPLVSGTWTGVASSADGSRLAAVYGSSSTPGYIYCSTDGGDSWTQRANAPNTSWSGIACSADGSKLVAVTLTASGTPIYISSQNSTTSGTTGYLSGAQHTAIELIYVGNGTFLPLNHEGTIRVY